MKRTTYITTRFDINNDFYVEVSPNGELIDFVLCMNNYGMKSYMFGMYKKDCPKENWEKLIANNINYYINCFMEDLIRC